MVTNSTLERYAREVVLECVKSEESVNFYDYLYSRHPKANEVSCLRLRKYIEYYIEDHASDEYDVNDYPKVVALEHLVKVDNDLVIWTADEYLEDVYLSDLAQRDRYYEMLREEGYK